MPSARENEARRARLSLAGATLWPSERAAGRPSRLKKSLPRCQLQRSQRHSDRLQAVYTAETGRGRVAL